MEMEGNRVSNRDEKECGIDSECTYGLTERENSSIFDHWSLLITLYLDSAIN